MSYIDKIGTAIEYLKLLPKNKRSFHFAYWVVPVSVGFCWYVAIEKQDIKNNITVIPLRSYITQSKQIFSKNGLIIITNELNDECKIPLQSNTSIAEVWTSLDDSSMKLNDDRISISNNNILKLNTPLYGENHILGMVIDGEANGELNMPGKTVFLRELLPVSTISITLVLSVFCGVAFGFGLILSEFSKSY